MAVFATQFNASLSSFAPNFRILSQVVAEKSLTEKKFTDRQTNKQKNTITEKAKTIYPYILHTGGITNPKGTGYGQYNIHLRDNKVYIYVINAAREADLN